MKQLVLILTFLTTFLLEKDKWFIWDIESRDTTERIIRENIHLIDYLPHEDGKYIDKFLDDFNILDIDSDGDLDIAYQGWSGAEPNCTRFFINKNEEYIKSAFVWGDAVDVESQDGGFIMKVHLPGCCADFEIRDYVIKVIVKTDSLRLTYLEEKIHHESTEKPLKLFDKPIEFEVQNNPYHLRITPEIDTTNYFYPEGPATNIYYSYKKGNTGKAIGQTIDKTGRTWWYVEMNVSKEHTGIDYAEIGILPKYVGWMSSRYLKKK